MLQTSDSDFYILWQKLSDFTMSVSKVNYVAANDCGTSGSATTAITNLAIDRACSGSTCKSFASAYNSYAADKYFGLVSEGNTVNG